MEKKSGDEEYPSYHIFEITNDHLQPLRDERHGKTFKKIAGNSLFGKNIFTPRSATFKQGSDKPGKTWKTWKNIHF